MSDYGAVGGGTSLYGPALRSYRTLAQLAGGYVLGGGHYGPSMGGQRGEACVYGAGRFQGGPFLQGWDGMDELHCLPVGKPIGRDITVG